jgi:hypothetical protein
MACARQLDSTASHRTATAAYFARFLDPAAFAGPRGDVDTSYALLTREGGHMIRHHCADSSTRGGQDD